MKNTVFFESSRSGRILSAALAVLIVMVLTFSVIPHAYAAEDLNITSLDSGLANSEIPLLVLVVSFDADGDGRNAYTNGYPRTDTSSPSFGEQWASSSEGDWEKICFSKTSKSLYTFYDEMSSGRFHFVPVSETYGTENNGIVFVTVKTKHPQAASSSRSTTSYSGERNLAILEADKYIDFSVYDKDGNGHLSYTELAVVFVIAGYNAKWSSGQKNDKCVWSEKSFEVSSTTWSASADGVKLLSSPGCFVYVGECMPDETPIAFGTIAHELGHALGAADLYTPSGYTWAQGPGEKALMGGGSGMAREGEKAGSSPAAINPYYLIDFGFQEAETAEDGTYTLYSRESTKGEYNIIRINTYNPREYYLIENRYTADKSSFDGIVDAAKAIMIWHIDESVISGTAYPDAYKNGTMPHPPGITVVMAGGTVGGNNAWDSSDGSFDCRSFNFIGVDSWTTLMTEEEAEKFGLKIEFPDNPGNEMRISVTGAVTLPVFLEVYKTDTELTSAAISGKITSLNCGTLSSLKAEISEKSDMSGTVSEVNIVPSGDGSFKAEFDGLTEGKQYFYKVTAEGSNGTSVCTGKLYTKSSPKINTDKFTVIFYRATTELDRPYEVTLDIGNPVTYKFPMQKSGYVLCGWYTDPELTDKYDLGATVTTTDTIYLYARWIKASGAATYSVSGATVKGLLFGAPVGGYFSEPELAEKPGYVFDGWYSDAGLTVPFSFDAPVEISGNITVYAKWKEAEQSTATEPVQTAATETTATEPVPSAENTTRDTVASEHTDKEEKSGGTIITVAVIAAVLLCAAVVFVLIRKRNKK